MAVAILEVLTPVASRIKTPEGIRLGKELERLRGEREWSQKALADRLGMSEEGYRNYVKGYGRITRHTLPKWANAFNMPIPELAGRLGIALLVEANASGLRGKLAELLPDASAEQLDRIAHRLPLLSPEDQQQILEGWDDHLLGRLTKLGLV